MRMFMKSISQLLIFSLMILFYQIPGVGFAQQRTVSPKVPPVKIIAPQDGCCIKVGEKLDIMVQVKSSLKVTSVTALNIDGKGIGMTNMAPYIVNWDTSNWQPGSYSIKAQVHLEDGRVLDSMPVEINIEGLPTPPAPVGSILKEGTPIILVTEETMVSGKIPKDATIHFRVDKDVIGPEGQILIPYGSTAYGKVLESRPHGMFGRPGKLDFTLESVNAADGTSVPVRAVRNATASDAGALVIVGALLLSVFFVFFCGNNVEIPKGTTFSAYINHDTLIAKPNVPRLAAADLNIARSITISDPAEGGKKKKEKEIRFSCAISPNDDSAYVRLYLDDDLIAWQKGNLSNIAWKNAKTGKVSTGSHVLFAEVTFSSGHIVKSKPVKFEIISD